MNHDFPGLFKHTSIYAVGNALQRGAGFVLLPLYINVLTLGEYGSLELIYSFSAIFAGVLGAGLAHATLRFFFEYDSISMSNRVVSTTLIATTVLSGTAIALSLRFSGELSALLFDGRHQLGISIALGTLMFELIRQIGLAYFRAKDYSTKYVVVSLLQFLIQVCTNIYTVAVLGLGVEGVLIGNFVAVFMGTCYVMYVTVTECGLRFSTSIFNTIVKYAYPFVFSSILSSITGNADRFIIRYFMSLEAVGIYALAMKFAQLLKLLLIDSFQLGFGSYRFSIMKNENAKEILTQFGTYYIAIVTFFAVGICLFSGEVIRLISENAYWNAINIVPLLVFATVFGSTDYILQTGILYQKSTGRLVYIGLTKAITVLSLDILLIPVLGVYGASLALIGSAFAVVATTFVVSQKLYPIDWHFKKAVVLLLWGCGVVLLSMLHTLEAGVLSFVTELGFTILFVSGIFYFNMLYGGELQQIRALLAKKR